MSAHEAKRQLHTFAKSGRNWRLMGLYLAHPEVPSGISERDLAKAWPIHESEKRALRVSDNPHPNYAPDKTYSFEEGSDADRQLSGAVKESDYQSGPFGERTLGADRAIKRALAYEDSVENLDVLFRKEIFDTVIEGSRKAEIARDASTVFPVDRAKGDHPRGQDTQFAPTVAEGAAIPDNSENHDTVEWDADRFGQGATATDRLIRQSLVSVIERNIEWIGHSVEMKANRLWLNELIDNAATDNDVDASAEDNRGVAAINKAIEQISLNDESPDTVVQHPTFTKTLFDTAENNAIIPFANDFGDDEGIRDRVAFPLLGLEGVRGDNGVYDPDGSNSWGYDSADDTGAVVYDSDRIGMYLFNDIEMKEYDDPVRDLQAINARMSVDFVYHKPEAASRIQYSVS